MWRYITLFFISTIIYSTSYAGIVYEEIPGNTVVPLQESKVVMDKQLVIVKDSGKVNATYYLTNESDTEFSMEIGFPFKKYTEPPLKLMLGEKIKDNNKFVVNVNDNEISIIKKEAKEIIRPYDYVYSWIIKFKPNETKVIKCIYNIQWSIDPVSYPDGTSMKYILDTGSLWKNPIKYTEINVALDDNISKLLRQNKIELQIKPDGYKVVDSKFIEWSFTNWNPSENISIIIWEK